MPAERGKDAAERLAAALDQGRSPRSVVDDDLARELAIVAMLRSQGAAYAPHPDAKARAKQRLMAALAEQNGPPVAAGRPMAVSSVTQFPVFTAEQTAPLARIDAVQPAPAAVQATPAAESTDDADDLASVTELASRRSGRHALTRPAGRNRANTPDPRTVGLARRAGLVGAAAMLVMVAFTGAGVFASRDALPGQTLYGLKRAAEAAGLAMTFDDGARARRNLELAAIRISELEQLIALGEISAVDPLLVKATMLEFDTAASEGSRTLLNDQGVAGGSGDYSLQAWAAKQSARLSALRSALPIPAVPAADNSIALLDKLIGRPTAQEAAPSPTVTGQAAERGTTESVTPGTRNTGGTEGRSGSPNAKPENGLPPIEAGNGPLGTDPAANPVPGQAPAQTQEQKPPAHLPIPLPGPPVTLPALLPGMPPLTIG